MATPISSVTEYCALLFKSKLLPAEEVEAVQRRWREETRGGEEQIDSFGKYLISRRILTPWQTAMVQRGRADGFFLDRYKILDQIGKGQMGGVYKAVHSLGQIVALKILPASRAKDQRVLGRFQRESRLLTQLDHPNVVRAFQVGEAGGRHFIVMEFLEGETLDEVLSRRKRLPIPESVRLIRQALDGLQHIHDKRTVHRDLKPSNLMILPGGKGGSDNTLEATVKIVDIGLGREMFDESAPEGAIDTQLTVEGSVVGTPDYMAPEQAKDARSADIRADIYSLGCVLYHCITGRTPFPDSNIMTQMLRHATENLPPLSNFAEGVPDGLQQVLNRLTAKRPEDRYQTPAEGSEALKRYETNSGGAAGNADAYRQWLETEAQAAAPNPLLPGPAAIPPPPPPKAPFVVKSGTAPAAPLPQSSYPKPGYAPAPPPPPLHKGYGAGPMAPPPPYPSQPTPGAGYPYPAPAAPPQRPPAPMSYPQAPREEEVDVELVTLSGAAPAPAPMPFLPPPHDPMTRLPEIDRPLTDLNRRDLFVLGAGGLGVLLAVGAGYALTSFIGWLRSPKPTTTDEPKTS